MHAPAPTFSVANVGAVAELQGMYGTFSFPERLLQQMWQRRDYDETDTQTQDGKALSVHYPGRWNHLGGPDFNDARLLLDGRQVRGDVELHLNAKDWLAHGHSNDPAYANVVLHVVLFPCIERFTLGVSGRMIPIVCLLPRLHHGLEEYAAEAAIEQLAGRPFTQAQETLSALSNDDVAAILTTHADQRWHSKVEFARLRIERLGWDAACHHAALEILGYRFNRAPMLTIAGTHPLAEWTHGAVTPEHVFNATSARWSVQGVRPLNHPRLRLRQYAHWCVARPDWAACLRRGAGLQCAECVPLGSGTAAWRQKVRLTNLRKQVNEDICAGIIGGSRFDNLVCDGFMPLLAAETGMDLAAAWTGWFAGDAPESAVQTLKGLNVFSGRTQPAAQGPIQGLLGYMLACDTRAHSAKGA